MITNLKDLLADLEAAIDALTFDQGHDVLQEKLLKLALAGVNIAKWARAGHEASVTIVEAEEELKRQ